MKGLALSKKYYEAYGQKLLSSLKEIQGQYAAGLCGRGSECFGFDDEISKDHDFGASFCIWLPKDTYQKYGQALQEEYEKLPKEFLGFQPRVEEAGGKGRVGVLCLEDFYYGILGTDKVPQNNKEWFALCDENLACVTNGEVFIDECGLFTKIRNGLLAYYPEDVRLKKLTASMARAARAGQYNYARAMKRGERVAAELSLHEFIKESMKILYLLNRRYAPFDKWLHRGMKELPIGAEIADMISLFYQIREPEKAWENKTAQDYLYYLNTDDGRVLIIEAICNIIVQELNAQGLSDLQDNFLQNHLPVVTEKIQDNWLRSMQFLEG